MQTVDVPSNGAGLVRVTARGGGCVVFRLAAGDTVRVTSPEGLQAGALFAISDDRAPLDGLTVTPELTLDACTLSGADNQALAKAFGRKLDGNTAALSAYDLFGAGGDGGEAATFKARVETLCLLAAPGGGMKPHDQDTVTDLVAEITRTSALVDLAPPLAEVKAEVRIAAASAEAFVIKAGDYIQIIDVEGRQCSDFLAFDAADLANGREMGLDPTTTRTLMGLAFPGPGLHSKYYDADQRPLVEVIRDTVGRHDTFMLACSAKYYDDMGYPGHSNCSDNFNIALTPHGVAPRKGWAAINFFYNTMVGHDGTISLDEPWSRPGDYVLLRALTDLVCAASSCADDIDPANAWVPTDIHVRVYDGDNAFSKGLAHRMTPDAEPQMTRQSGFHARTSALTRNLIDYKGFWSANCYAASGPVSEYWACRERAIVMDLSALRKFEITGPDAEALMQRAFPRNVRKLAVGQIVYSALCYEHGGMIDDGTIFRLAQDNFRWVCGDDYCGVWLRQLAEKHALKAWVRNSTDQLNNIAVQGPRSRDILAKIVVTPAHQPTLTELKWFRFTIGKIGDVPVVVSRTGYTGELGFEVWCHPDRAADLWDIVWAAGEPEGMLPMGLLALDMVRIEAGLVFAAYDFCDQTDPFEAGIGFTVPVDKPEAYIGDEALKARRDNPMRKMVGLEIAGGEGVLHGDPIYIGRAQIGVVTSATRSPVLGKSIALARLDVRHAAAETAVEIGKLDGHQKRIGAVVTGFPAYDPQKTRVRA